MPAASVERKLAAIFAADIAGYSRLMARDEVGTLVRLKAGRAIVDGLIASYRGRIFNTAGDSVVADFASAVDAVQCAAAVQAALSEEIAAQSADDRLAFRIGVHVGDVIVDGTNLFGDGVNIAARLEALAEPGGVCISAAAREQVGDKLPFGFDDLGEQQVKNIPHPLRVYRVKAETSPAAARPATAPAGLPLPDKPSIAVLPFQNMTGDPEQEYFVDGMVEEITTAISRLPWLFVIARNSSFTYKGKAVDVRQVACDLGVRYVLEGSVRKAGHRVRITGQLIDTATGAHIWADRFDGALDDIFELQDQIATSVVGAIEPSLRRAEIARAYAKPTERLDAYDLYLRALGHFYTQRLPALELGVELLGEAIRIDPDYAAAKALLSTLYVWRDTSGLGTPEESKIAIALARDALSSNEDDPDTLRFAAHTISHLAHDYDLALAALSRALRLNPNNAQVLMITGWVHIHRGEPEHAFEFFERAKRISPLDGQMGWILSGVGTAHLMSGRNEQGLAFLKAASEEMPQNSHLYRTLAFAYVRLGRIDEARAVVERFRQLDPSYRVSQLATPFRNQAFTEELRAAMRIAGIPE